MIIDDYSEMEIVSDNPVYIPDTYSYFSVLSIEGNASGICEENVKFPLSDGEITCLYQYGTSNEVNPGQTAKIYVKHGKLLLIKIY